MKNFKDFLCTDFIPLNKNIRSKDRLPFSCPECDSVTIARVDNVKTQIQKSGTYKCWGCSVSEGKMKGGKITNKEYQYYMDLAFQKASIKSDDEEPKVGAVFISPYKKVEEIAVNSFVSGHNSEILSTGPEKHEFMIHAGVKLLYQCCEAGVKTKGGTVVCTSSPCMECLRALKQSGVKDVVFKDCYPKFGNVVEFYENNKEFEIKIYVLEDLGYYKLEINNELIGSLL